MGHTMTRIGEVATSGTPHCSARAIRVVTAVAVVIERCAFYNSPVQPLGEERPAAEGFRF